MAGRPPHKPTSTPWPTSFIVRCWQDDSGNLRARLLDVRTRVAHLVVNLDALPELIRRLAGPGNPVPPPQAQAKPPGEKEGGEDM